MFGLIKIGVEFLQPESTPVQDTEICRTKEDKNAKVGHVLQTFPQ
jgi:hypothetical protein